MDRAGAGAWKGRTGRGEAVLWSTAVRRPGRLKDNWRLREFFENGGREETSRSLSVFLLSLFPLTETTHSSVPIRHSHIVPTASSTTSPAARKDARGRAIVWGVEEENAPLSLSRERCRLSVLFFKRRMWCRLQEGLPLVYPGCGSQ